MVLPVRVLTKICMVPFFDSLFTKSRQGLSVPSLTPSLMRNCDVSLLLSLSLSLFLSLFWLEIEKKKKSGGGGRKERDFYTRKEKNSARKFQFSRYPKRFGSFRQSSKKSRGNESSGSKAKPCDFNILMYRHLVVLASAAP